MTITLVSTTGVELPLQDVDIVVDVDGTGFIALVTQTFANDLADPTEVVYRFPLPLGAAVTDCVIRIGDREIRAELRDRDEARVEYEEAIAEGHTASLMEQTGAERFELTVGNIAPGEQIEVVIVLHGTVTVDGTEATLRFPTVVAPTYADNRPDPLRIADGHLGIDTRFTVTLHGVDTTPVVVSHDLEGRPGCVELIGVALDRDVIVRWEMPTSITEARWVADPDASGQGTLEVVVRQEGEASVATPTDVVLLVDRSGSMSGWGEKAATQLTQDVVESLGPDDTVTVIAFDSISEVLPVCTEGPVRPTGAVLERLKREIAAHLTTRGGTEMGVALRHASEVMPAAAPGGDRVLILVTDGQYGDEQEAARLRREVFPGVRIVVVGVDMAVNGGFLARLADGGHVELIESSQRAAEVSQRIAAKVRPPLYGGLTIEGAADQPRTSGVDVYPGVLTRLQGRMGRPDGPVTLRAGDGTTFTVEVTHSDDASIRSRWASARLADLIDAQRAADVDGEARRAIVALSIAHRVLCEYTAWLAVDRSGALVDGVLRRVEQPAAVPAGWNMFGAGDPMLQSYATIANYRTVRRPTIFPDLPSYPQMSKPSFEDELREAIADLEAGGDLTSQHLRFLKPRRPWQGELSRKLATMGKQLRPGPLSDTNREQLLDLLRSLLDSLQAHK